MALLSFPSSPTNGQLYPTTPLPGQNQYEWESADQTWRLLGAATTVIPGCYGDPANVPTFCVNAQGRITSVVDVPIVLPWTAKGQLIVGTGVNTQTLLNAGTDTSLLVADSTTSSGLVYTSSLKSAVLLPVGNNTGERPAAPVVGQVRYNNVANEFEGYSGAAPVWQPLSGQPTGGGSDKIFYTNSQVVTTSYTLPAGKNAMSAGPIALNAGVTVTIPAGAAWTVV